MSTHDHIDGTIEAIAAEPLPAGSDVDQLEAYCDMQQALAERTVHGWNPQHPDETLDMAEKVEAYAHRAALAISGWAGGDSLEFGVEVEVRWGPEFLDVAMDAHSFEGREHLDYWRFDLLPSQRAAVREDLVALAAAAR